MKNAAALLADLLRSWDIPPGNSSGGQRSKVAGDIGLWGAHKLAMGYLLQIERDIDALEASGSAVRHYRLSLKDWYEAVFSYHFGWQSGVNPSNTVAVIDDRDLRLLDALADVVDQIRLAPPTWAEQRAAIRDQVAAAQDLVASAPPEVLNDAARRYLLGLIFEALRVVDEIELRGAAALRSVTFELGGAMGLIADGAKDEETQKTWRRKSRELLTQWAAVPPKAALTTATSEVVKGIIGG